MCSQCLPQAMKSVTVSYSTIRGSSVVTKWARTYAVMGWKPDNVKFFFCFMQPPYCYFTSYKELQTKYLYFSTVYYFTSLYGPTVSLVSNPPHKFVRPPCWYYWLYEIRNYDFRVGPNGITPIRNAIQIRPGVLALNRTDRRTDVVTLNAFISCTSCKECTITRYRRNTER
jgi:hypothetical protein